MTWHLSPQPYSRCIQQVLHCYNSRVTRSSENDSQNLKSIFVLPSFKATRAHSITEVGFVADKGSLPKSSVFHDSFSSQILYVSVFILYYRMDQPQVQLKYQALLAASISRHPHRWQVFTSTSSCRIPRYFNVGDLSIDSPTILTEGVEVWTLLLFFRENHVNAAFVGFTSATDWTVLAECTLVQPASQHLFCFT